MSVRFLPEMLLIFVCGQQKKVNISEKCPFFLFLFFSFFFENPQFTKFFLNRQL